MNSAEEQNAQGQSRDEKDPTVRVVDRRWWARGETAADVESGVRKPTYVEELEKRLADSTMQLQQVMSEYRRALDEFEQVRIRLRRDSAREVERARRAQLADLLEVLDNLDRAVKAGREPGAASGPDGQERVARGIELVREQFLNKLEAAGVKRVPAVGRLFDAQKHEAIGTAPVDSSERDGIVVEVVKEGYSVGDDVLRPAAVVVGKFANP